MSEKVRAKFVCEFVEPWGEGTHVRFSAVTSGSPENDTFFNYTPAGSLEMSVVNERVKFEEGKEYYLDFTPAED